MICGGPILLHAMANCFQNHTRGSIKLTTKNLKTFSSLQNQEPQHDVSQLQSIYSSVVLMHSSEVFQA